MCDDIFGFFRDGLKMLRVSVAYGISRYYKCTGINRLYY